MWNTVMQISCNSHSTKRNVNRLIKYRPEKKLALWIHLWNHWHNILVNTNYADLFCDHSRKTTWCNTVFIYSHFLKLTLCLRKNINKYYKNTWKVQQQNDQREKNSWNRRNEKRVKKNKKRNDGSDKKKSRETLKRRITKESDRGTGYEKRIACIYGLSAWKSLYR